MTRLQDACAIVRILEKSLLEIVPGHASQA